MCKTELELVKEKRWHFLYRVFCPKEYQCILYWIHFQNTHTFTYQKTLLHTHFCLFLKSLKAFNVYLSSKPLNVTLGIFFMKNGSTQRRTFKWRGFIKLSYIQHVVLSFLRQYVELIRVYPGKIRLDEDVLKTSWSRPIYSSWPYIFKTSSRRFQDVLQKRLQDIS